MRTALTCLLTLTAVTAAPGGEAAFTARPAATRDGDKIKIAFTVSAPTDVEVAVVNAKGEVVRSLAAGVLGAANPPPKPFQPGLAQDLVWDGKGDWGLPAGDGPFRVRVRLGMGANFGRLIGDSPYNFREMECRGMAVDRKNGDLYCLLQRGRGSTLSCLRVYDRTGKYLREIMPYPANLDAGSRETFGALAVPGVEAPVPVNYYHLWPVFYPFPQFWSENRGNSLMIAAMHPTEEALVLMSDSFQMTYRIRKADGGVAGNPLAEPLWDDGKAPAGRGTVSAITAAISPDGKTMYCTGYCLEAPKGEKLHPQWPEGRVYRKAGDGKAERFADVALPADAPGARASDGPHTSACCQNLHGLAVDSKGNVLVCDAKAAKIRVFSPDGKVIETIETPPGPYALALNEKAGAIYVVTRRAVGPYMPAESLVKISGWRAGGPADGGPTARVAAKLAFDVGSTGRVPYIAADLTGEVPQIWVSGAPRHESLLRVEDRGDKLAAVEDLAERGKAAAGFACRMDVDPEVDLVYLNNGWGLNLRYNGLTGEYAGRPGRNGQPEMIIASELCVRRDGMVYLSGGDYGGGGYSGPWHRLNRDLTPAPLADRRKQFADRYGKMGGGYFGNQGSCVTPDGRLYVNGMFLFRSGGIFEVSPDGTPGRGSRLKELLAEKPAAGGFKSALVGWLPDKCGGVEVDQQGNIYVGISALPLNCTLPGDLEKMLKNPAEIVCRLDKTPLEQRSRVRRMTNPYGGIGSVIKFGPSGGGPVPKLKAGTAYKIPLSGAPAVVPEKLEDGLPLMADNFTVGLSDRTFPTPEVHVEGALKIYPLLAPFSRACGCQTPRFDVDDYGRLYIPNALASSVRVVDNQGNEILTFGSYGNCDSQGSGSAQPKPEIPMAYPVAAKASFKHIYVADSANRRAVRVDPTWKAEETCDVR